MANGVVGTLVDTSSNTHKIASTAFGTCSTAASTQIKEVIIGDTSTDFSLIPGIQILVKFTNAQTFANGAKLQINGGESKFVKIGGAAAGNNAWLAGEIREFVYDGTCWELLSPKYATVTGKPTANQTPGFGSTFTISQISQKANGGITATDRTVKIPNATATTSAAGLMSAADKTKLDDLASSNIVRCIAGSITAGQTSGTITTPVNGEPIGLTAFDNNFNEIIVDWVLVANNDSTCTVTASIASAVSYNIVFSCIYAISSNL